MHVFAINEYKHFFLEKETIFVELLHLLNFKYEDISLFKKVF